MHNNRVVIEIIKEKLMGIKLS